MADSEPLRPSARNNEEPDLRRGGGGGGVLVGAKTVCSLDCYYSYFLPYAEKAVRCYKAAKEGESLYYWCDIVQSRHRTQHRNSPRQADWDLP